MLPIVVVLPQYSRTLTAQCQHSVSENEFFNTLRPLIVLVQLYLYRTWAANFDNLSYVLAISPNISTVTLL